MFLLFLCDLCVRSLCLIFRASLNMDYSSALSWNMWSAECTRFLWVFESICFFTCLWNYDLSRTARGNNLYGSISSRSRCSFCSRMYSFALMYLCFRTIVVLYPDCTFTLKHIRAWMILEGHDSEIRSFKNKELAAEQELS